MATPGAPPLRVWALALSIVLLFFAVLGNLEALGVLPANAAYLQRLNLGRLAAPPDAGIRVSALGSSKAYAALEYDHRFARRLAASGTPVRFMRFTSGGPTESQVASALEAMLAAPPDVLLLEEDLLLIDRRKVRPFDLRERLRKLRTDLRVLGSRSLDRMAISSGENFGQETWKSDDACRVAKSASRLREYAVEARRWRTVSRSRLESHLRLLRAFQRAGTRVILIDLPRSPAAQRMVPASFVTATARLRGELQRQEGFPTWTPGPLAESLYCDQGHLDRQGRERYSRWLARELTVLLEQEDV